MDSWITAYEMAELHGIQKDTLDMFAWHNKGSEYIKKVGKINLYNESALLRRQRKHSDKYHKATENYWWLVDTAGIVEHAQAVLVCEETGVGAKTTWNQFLARGLWIPIYDRSILHVNAKTMYLDIYYKWSNDKIKAIKEGKYTYVPKKKVYKKKVTKAEPKTETNEIEYQAKVDNAFKTVRRQTNVMLKKEVQKLREAS